MMMIVGFQAIAYALDAREHALGSSLEAAKSISGGVFAAYILFSGAAWLLYVTNRPSEVVVGEQRGMGGETLSPATQRSELTIGLFAIGMSFVAQGSVWAFMQTLGVTHGFSLVAVANAMTVYATFGVVGSFSSASLPQVVKRWIAIGGALALLAVGLYGYTVP